MSELDRIRFVVNYLILKGHATTQSDLGKILGYTNQSSFSQVLNGKVAIPRNLIPKLKMLEPNLNENWVKTGNGDMLLMERHNKNTRIVGEVSGNAIATLGDGSPVIKDGMIEIESMSSVCASIPRLLGKCHEQIQSLQAQLAEVKMEISRLQGRFEEKDSFIKMLMEKK